MSVRAMGAGSHWQGRAMSLWPENSFILTIKATKNRILQCEKWLEAFSWTCLEPLPGKIPAHALGTSLEDVIPMTTVRSVGRNFSKGGLPGARQPFYSFQVVARCSTPIFGRFNGQNERIFGPVGGHDPPYQCLSTPMMTVLQTKRVYVVKARTGNTEC